MTKLIIPASAAEKLLKRGGAERVSKDAKTAFAQIVEKLAAQYAEQAANIARMEGRTTVRESDIKRATETIK